MNEILIGIGFAEVVALVAVAFIIVLLIKRK